MPHTRNPRVLVASVTAVTAALLTTPASAFDARSIALGGSTVANGLGVHGAIDNPASLAAANRRGQTAMFLIGGALDARDHGNVVETLTDSDIENLVDDLETEIDELSGSQVSDDCTGAGFIANDDDTVCVTGTAALAGLSAQALDTANAIDGQKTAALGESALGFAVTSTPIPFAIHTGARATGYGVASITDGDREYVNAFVGVLADDVLTLGEIRDSEQFTVTGTTVDVTEPEDVITSNGEVAAMSRVHFGFSVATSVEIAAYSLDIGVTPRFSRLTAYGLNAELVDSFEDDVDSIGDQFEDSKTEESSVSFDLGVSTDLPTLPLRISAVVHNVIPESITTNTGFEFETTPQLLAGVLHQRERLSFMASLALNSASVDGIETQPVALGVEFASGPFALRGGISADLGRDDDAVALSAGFKLGPLEVGGRLAGLNSGQIGAQIAFGF